MCLCVHLYICPRVCLCVPLCVCVLVLCVCLRTRLGVCVYIGEEWRALRLAQREKCGPAGQD